LSILAGANIVSAMSKVIYIMGEGRSGSTILDLLLGNHSRIFGAGELWAFWADPSITGNCSCGAAFQECEFWQRARDAFLERVGDPDLGRSGSLRTRRDRARRLSLRWAGFGKPRGDDRYSGDTRAIFETLRELSGKPVIVDSTKQVGRAQNLLDVDGLDVFVIHLVRDGRGVVWSRMRDVIKNPTLKRHSPVQSIVNWRVKNSLAMNVGRKAADRYLRVRYEDLIRDTDGQLRRIGELCGLSFDEVICRLAETGEFEAGHQIGGNAAARTGRGPKKLRLDEQWKRSLPARYDFLFRVIAGGVARKLGYGRD